MGLEAWPMHAASGIYRALVVDRDDPEHRYRLKVHVPASGADAWAEACLPFAIFTLPEVGDMVWVAWEDGDPRFPVWLGVLPVRRS
jgi:uncharacterized protein involved in type VI secretion and phage assembly